MRLDRLRLNESGRYQLILAVLLGGAILMVAALAAQTWNTARVHRSAAERVLRDYAAFSSWTFGSRVRSEIFVALNPVFAGADGARTPAEAMRGMRAAADSIERCRCGVNLSPRYFFFVDLGSGAKVVDRRKSALPEAELTQRIEQIERSAAASMAKGITSREPGALPYRMIASSTGRDNWVVFYAARFRDASDPGLIVGFEADSQEFTRNVFGATLYSAPLLPHSLTKQSSNDSLLSVTVRNSSGAPIYSSGRVYSSGLSATQPIAGTDSGLSATVTINPAAANALIIGGIPESPVRQVLPLMIGILGLLTLAFVLMWKREVSSLEVKASLSEARLSALRGQLQPHFLFNVLNTIAMLARKGDTRGVVEMLSGLSELLRRVLADSPKSETTLSEELDFVERYLALEQVRYGDRLGFDISVDGSLGNAMVPSLILQPIVENALRHGIAQRREGGRIEVSARTLDHALHLEVRNDGNGLAGNGKSGNGLGVGLRNTRERLQHLYGDAAGLTIDSGEQAGTRVVIRIPLSSARGG